MTTYGPGSRRSPKQSSVRGSSRSAAPTSSNGRSNSSGAARASGSSSSRREQASADLRGAIQGRENEFAGIAFIAVGLLIGLSAALPTDAGAAGAAGADARSRDGGRSRDRDGR